MDLGLSLSAFHDFKIEDALDACARLADRFGLTACEINLQFGPGAAGEWPRDVSEERFRSFAARFPIRGTHLPFLDLNLIASNSGIRHESRRQITEAIDLSARLGMTYVVCHAAGFCLGEPWEQEKKLWVELFRSLSDRAAALGMTFCIENGECLVQMDRLLEVVEEIGSDRARICLDVGHAHQRLRDHRRLTSRILPRLDERWRGSFRISRLMPFEAYGSLAGFLGAAEARIHHFHLHDRRGRTDHLGLRQGGVDLDALVPFLRKRPVILEIPLSSEAGLAREIERAQSLIERSLQR